MRPLRWLIALAWYGTGLYFVLRLIRGPLLDALHRYHLQPNDPATLLDVIAVGLGGLLLIAFFVLVAILVRRTVETVASQDAGLFSQSNTSQNGQAFPARATLLVGVWLLVISLVSTVSLLTAIVRPAWLIQLLQGAGQQEAVADALVTMLAAAVGGCISTILGYLQHASIEKDFDVAYLPWYIARPVMSLLLGLVFFFLFKGGLLATLPGGAPDLNDFGLAGIGGLIGLFSKNAIEKLREIFNVLFATQEDRDQSLYDRLPKDLQAQIAPYLPQSTRRPPRDESGEQAEPRQSAPGDPA